MFLELSAVLLGLVFYYGFYSKIQYWTSKGVKCSKWPLPLIGNCAGIFWKKSFLDITTDLYREFPDRYNGVYVMSSRSLLIRDLTLLKHIFVKDFDHFVDRRNLIDECCEPILGRTLLSLRGERWREMRATLSPAFTGSKMRAMFDLMVDCARDFTDHFIPKGEQEIDVRANVAKFTIDVIASTAFGVKCNSVEDPENEFFKMAQLATDFTGIKRIKLLLISFPKMAQFLKIKIFPQELDDFFKTTIKSNIEQRESQGIIRHDMIHLLMEARKGRLKHESDTTSENGSDFAAVEESDIGKNAEYQKRELTDDDITAQALLFFIGGFDTVSTSCCFLAHELAVNPDVQTRVQEEIDVTLQKCDKGKVTYNSIVNMKYLDQVISEALRMWPPLFQLERQCTKDYLIEPVTPEEKPYWIRSGDVVFIPMFGFHRDPKYFPDPDRFDPDRFSDENKSKLVPGSYMPFGQGPRNCIGSRFALLELKVLFFHLLSKFNLTVIEKTTVPMKLSSTKVPLGPENGFWFGLKPRETTLL